MSKKQIGWKFDNTYPKLPSVMLSKIKPTPVKDPQVILLNNDLSKEIDLDFDEVNDNELAQIFSGNKLPEGSKFNFSSLWDINLDILLFWGTA